MWCGFWFFFLFIGGVIFKMLNFFKLYYKLLTYSFDKIFLSNLKEQLKRKEVFFDNNLSPHLVLYYPLFFSLISLLLRFMGLLIIINIVIINIIFFIELYFIFDFISNSKFLLILNCLINLTLYFFFSHTGNALKHICSLNSFRDILQKKIFEKYYILSSYIIKRNYSLPSYKSR